MGCTLKKRKEKKKVRNLSACTPIILWLSFKPKTCPIIAEKGPIIAKNVSHDGTPIKKLCSEIN